MSCSAVLLVRTACCTRRPVFRLRWTSSASDCPGACWLGARSSQTGSTFCFAGPSVGAKIGAAEFARPRSCLTSVFALGEWSDLAQNLTVFACCSGSFPVALFASLPAKLPCLRMGSSSATRPVTWAGPAQTALGASSLYLL